MWLMAMSGGLRLTKRQRAQALSHMPNVQNVKALTQHQFGYRLRIGRYRVLFDWEGSVKIVNIEEVSKRDEHTY